MRFAATHKSVSYLMVSVAFLMLVLAGEVPGILAALSTAAIAGSYFCDPQSHPFMNRRAFSGLLYAILAGSLLLLLPDPTQGETLWDSGTRFLCVLLCVKLWRRRNNGDYLQAYLISFLMLLIASLVGASIVYAVCLLLYSIFATWTLSLFHLRREMEENYLLKHLPGRHGQAAESERVEVERILSSRRVVGTPFLLATGSLALVLFVIGGLLFLLLPRVGVGLELPLRRRGLLLTGFAEQIQLGGHGLLRENPRVVMRVELNGGPSMPTLLGSGLRFRGTAFSYYQDGKWWHQAPLPTGPQTAPSTGAAAFPGALHGPAPVSPGLALADAPNGTPPILHERPVPHRQGHHFLDSTTPSTSLQDPGILRAEIYLEPLETSALFVPVLTSSASLQPSRPLALTLPSSWYYAAQWPLQQGQNDELFARSRPGSLHYTVYLKSPVVQTPSTSAAVPPTSRGPDTTAATADAHLVLAAASLGSVLQADRTYLQIPPSLEPRLRTLANQITAGLSRPQDKARALERYLQTQFSYSTQLLPLSESERSRHQDPIAAFLFERKRGHCEYFASALSLLLRAVDIPSRSVNGYLGGEWNEFGGYIVVRQQHAHSWVEAFVPTEASAHVEKPASGGPETDGAAATAAIDAPDAPDARSPAVESGAWITLDPTPLSALNPGRHGFLQRARRFSDSVEMSWNKYVLEYDPRAQQRLADRLRNVFRVSQTLRAPAGPTSRHIARTVVIGILSVGLLVAAIAGLRRLKLRGSLRLGFGDPSDKDDRHRRGVQAAARAQLKRALSTLRKRGFVQKSGETLQKLAERIQESGEPCAPHFQKLVSHYYAHRFGEQDIDLPEITKLSDAMANSPRRPESPSS